MPISTLNTMNVPTINCYAMVFRQGELSGFVTVDLRCPGLILQPMLEV